MFTCLCAQTQPIPIPPAPLSTLVPPLRCSVEGLNQELEGMFISQSLHPLQRVINTYRAHTCLFTQHGHVKMFRHCFICKERRVSEVAHVVFCWSKTSALADFCLIKRSKKCSFLSRQLLEVPDGHRAPVPLQSCSSGSQSDPPTTPPPSSSSASSSPCSSPNYICTSQPNSDAPPDLHQG